jgi:hypothetical protein
MKIALREMRLAIYQTFDCQATRCVEVVKVEFDSDRSPIDVYLFKVEGHPDATKCYAWGIPIDEKIITIQTMLQTDELNTAKAAVDSYRSQK